MTTESKDAAVVDSLAQAVDTGLNVSDATTPYDRWNMVDDATIDYGYLAKTGGTGIAETKQGFYITTAINYTNGPAHMGHAYEAATSDVIARCERLKGTHPVYFVTGADEHGQKIANTASDQGKAPIDICNQVRCVVLTELVYFLGIRNKQKMGRQKDPFPSRFAHDSLVWSCFSPYSSSVGGLCVYM